MTDRNNNKMINLINQIENDVIKEITEQKELNELLKIIINEKNNNLKNMDTLLFEQLKTIRNKNEEIINLNNTINYYKKVIYYTSSSTILLFFIILNFIF